VANPVFAEKYRRQHLWKNYRLTPEQFEQITTTQGGLCAICQTPMTKMGEPVVDHDHTTGCVRGLLCRRCNGVLASFEDERLREAMLNYLRKHAEPA
jgi:hypothetical protein